VLIGTLGRVDGSLLRVPDCAEHTLLIGIATTQSTPTMSLRLHRIVFSRAWLPQQ